jgi:hypothetical protein
MDMQGKNYINHCCLIEEWQMKTKGGKEGRNSEPPKSEALHQEGLLGNANANANRGARDDDDEGTYRQATFDEFTKCREMRSSTVPRERERRWADCWERERCLGRCDDDSGRKAGRHRLLVAEGNTQASVLKLLAAQAQKEKEGQAERNG